MSVTAIIPARFASRRFPGKALVPIDGKSMIRHVYDQVSKVDRLEKVIVATDDRRIYEEVSSHGGHTILTGSHHLNGTSRCAEVAQKLKSRYYLNVQGDEPYIHPQSITSLLSILDGHVELATLIKKITDPSELTDPNTVKVVVNHSGEALYFSRQPIPMIREYPLSGWLQQHTYYKHIGIYAYRADILHKISKLPPSPLETAESLEQLRWIENGYRIRLAETPHESISIDTPEDLHRLTKMTHA